MKKAKIIVPLFLLIILTLSFTANTTVNFRNLDFKVENGCSTGYSSSEEQYNDLRGYYNFEYKDCGFEKPKTIYSIKFPAEVKKIIADMDARAKTTKGKSEIEFNVGKYNCSATISDSLNYEYSIWK